MSYQKRVGSCAVMELAEKRVLLTAVGATQLVILQQPGDTVVGKKISPIIVDLLDSSGNVVTDDNSTVTLSLIGTSEGTQAGYASAKIKDGEAIFTKVSIAMVGTYSVQATDGALTSDSSNSFTISAGKASGLIFSQSPMGQIDVGDAISLQLKVVDRFGNVTSDVKHRVINISLGSHPRRAVLYGLSKETTDNGQATFNNLSVSLPGDYTLKATFGGPVANSAEFVVSYNGSGNISTDSNTNSFILPYTARVVLQPIGGEGGATSEFGLGTSQADTLPLFEGLPQAKSGSQDAGTYQAGMPLDMYIKTVWNGSVDYAFSDDTIDAPSRTSFMDLDNSLGLGGSIYQKVNDKTYIMHLDDAASYNIDDDDSDIFIKITLVPVAK